MDGRNTKRELELLAVFFFFFVVTIFSLLFAEGICGALPPTQLLLSGSQEARRLLCVMKCRDSVVRAGKQTHK